MIKLDIFPDGKSQKGACKYIFFIFLTLWLTFCWNWPASSIIYNNKKLILHQFN